MNNDKSQPNGNGFPIADFVGEELIKISKIAKPTKTKPASCKKKKSCQK